MVETVRLPKYPTAKSLPALIECAASILACHDSEITCDGSNVSFVDPCGLAVFSCVAKQVLKHNKIINLNSFSPDILSYMSRMDSFREFMPQNRALGSRQPKSNSLLEVTNVVSSRDTEEVSERIAQAIVGQVSDLAIESEPDAMTGMTLQDQLSEPLKYIFTELLDNVFHHGQKEGNSEASAWVCVQYTPSNDLIRLAIVDDGCGFLVSLNGHPDLIYETDIAAIKLSLQERKSGNMDLLLRGPDHSANQGVGLTVVSHIIKKVGGKMWVATGKAIFAVHNDSSVELTSSWQGSVLALEFSRSALMKIRHYQVINGLKGSDLNQELKLNFI